MRGKSGHAELVASARAERSAATTAYAEPSSEQAQLRRSALARIISFAAARRLTAGMTCSP